MGQDLHTVEVLPESTISSNDRLKVAAIPNIAMTALNTTQISAITTVAIAALTTSSVVQLTVSDAVVAQAGKAAGLLTITTHPIVAGATVPAHKVDVLVTL